MKVIQACVSRSANQREDDEDNVDTVIFLLRFTWLPPSYVHVVSIAHLVVQRLIGITHQACTSGTARIYPESEGSSMTCLTRVALRGSRGVSIIPLTKLFFGAPHKLLAGFDGDHHQVGSRRWQSPRVISTTGLQDDHLVPLDATTRCNRTRIAHSLNRMNIIKQE
jgi:hypothetical protein